MSDAGQQGASQGADQGAAGMGAASLLMLEALKGGADLSSLLTLLSLAPLSAEQRGVLDLLQALQPDDEAPDDEAEETAGAAAPRPRAARQEHRQEHRQKHEGRAWPEDTAEATAEPDELEALRHELADLREVNDILAAALGACRACWGGDAGCPLCDGRGRAGGAVPDPGLFDALVLPAVRRMRGARQTPWARPGPPPRRARSHHPFPAEASP